MNEKALRVLEYYKIIEMLEQYAGSAPGKELCRGLLPSGDLAEIRQMQTETSDALSRVFRSGSISFSGLRDLRPSIARLKIGSSMNAAELLRVVRILEIAAKAKAYSSGNNSSPEDSLEALFRALDPLSSLCSEIRRCIPDEDEIADDASPELRRIRRSMSVTQDRIRSTLNSMISGGSKIYLQDTVITQRNGRYCIPVKAEHRSMVPGMIHDQSSSGSTLFIEPMSVVRLNNEVRELEIAEKKEIEAILANLSNQVAEEGDSLIGNIEILRQLDFIFARALLSRQMRASEPVFNDEGIIDLKKARHPLLDPAKAVPIELRIGEQFDQLVISGPNTGGKTVSLKTAGLLTLMGQAGLHIPAGDHSRLGVFTEIFADIGDEQSIEQSLSTFSSHMKNIVSFMDKADPQSLVLFDELGAGTDPTEGAALAIAVLSDLHERGVKAIATTHYSELKVYALSTPGVENACCEFNVDTLKPTYRLLIGIPGKSNAFAISRRLGLPERLIDSARAHISIEAEKFEDLVADLETQRLQAQEERQQALSSLEEAKKLRSKYENSRSLLEERREKYLSQAREEAAAILREAKSYADETIRRYQKYGSAAGSAREMEQERARIRERIDELERSARKAASKPQGSAADPNQLRVGDYVRVRSLNLEGTVSTLPDAKGNLFVQMGILRSQVNISDLELSDRPREEKSEKPKTGAGRIKMSKSASVSTEINLIGKTTDEAITDLDKYLDDACMAHLESVRIVHGKGTGALRNAVQKYLRSQKRVKSFRLGEFGEGDAGVTIASLRF